MNLNRRRFIAGLLGTTAVALAPWQSLQAAWFELAKTTALNANEGVLTEDSLEQALIAIRQMRDAAGLRVMATPTRFILRPCDLSGLAASPS